MTNIHSIRSTRRRRTRGGGRLGRRHEILALVRGGSIRSQEELQRRLRRRGFRATQPTLSRDVKALGLAKTAAGYLAPPSTGFAPDEKRHKALDRALREFALWARRAGSLVVLRTPVAGAQPLAHALDDAELDGVVGTVAGDDTVFVATPGASGARRLERRLRASLTPQRAAARARG